MQQEKNMQILIIGGSGHVSGAVTRNALSQGHEVWTVTRGKRSLPKEVKSLIVDRHDNKTMEALILEQGITWDMVVDCICYDIKDIQQDIAIFRKCAKQFVLVSTDFVYNPALRQFPQPENAACLQNNTVTPLDYGLKKRIAEQELINGDTGDMAWTIVRPCHIYGPTSELGCLPLHGRDPHLIETLRSGMPIKLIGGGHFLQQPILADDLAKTIISIAGNSNAHSQIFNTAGPDIIESWQYYQIIANVLGVKLTIEEIPVQAYLEEHPDKTPFLCHRIYDLTHIKNTGLSVPSTPIKEGLRQHVEGILARPKS